MTSQLIIFFGLGLVAVASALAMVFSRNAVYAALYLILNFGTIAIFYLMLNAPFISLVQITVYAGAIMVLFLFVIMLLGAEQTGRHPAKWWMQPLALGLGGILLLEVLYIVFTQGAAFPPAVQTPADFGAPAVIGETLFREYLLPFEVTSILLLVAMIGAIVLTVRRKKL